MKYIIEVTWEDGTHSYIIGFSGMNFTDIRMRATKYSAFAATKIIQDWTESMATVDMILVENNMPVVVDHLVML